MSQQKLQYLGGCEFVFRIDQFIEVPDIAVDQFIEVHAFLGVYRAPRQREFFYAYL